MSVWVQKRAAIQLWEAFSHADRACLVGCASKLTLEDFMLGKPFTRPAPQKK